MAREEALRDPGRRSMVWEGAELDAASRRVSSFLPLEFGRCIFEDGPSVHLKGDDVLVLSFQGTRIHDPVWGRGTTSEEEAEAVETSGREEETSKSSSEVEEEERLGREEKRRGPTPEEGVTEGARSIVPREKAEGSGIDGAGRRVTSVLALELGRCIFDGGPSFHLSGDDTLLLSFQGTRTHDPVWG